jgi:hypothetical protein
VRAERRGIVLRVRELAPSVVELLIGLPAGLAPAFWRPGSFVLVRPRGKARAYDTPLTVIAAGSSGLRLVFGVSGPKTRSLAAMSPGDAASWRGPYYNGLFGASRFDRARGGGPGFGGHASGRHGFAVLVARGVGQAVALPLLRYLTGAGLRAEVLLDARGTGGDFAASELGSMLGAAPRPFACFTPRGGQELREALASLAASASPPVAGAGRWLRGLVVSLGSDLQHRWVGGLWPSLSAAVGGRGLDLVATNNRPVVCGEGVCGACVLRLSGGGRVRACKADVDPLRLWSPSRAGSASEGEP